MMYLISFLLASGVLIFLEYLNTKKLKQEKLAFYKWQNQVLSNLEKISNKY